MKFWTLLGILGLSTHAAAQEAPTTEPVAGPAAVIEEEPAPPDAEVAFWIHLDPLDIPPMPVTIQEWDDYSTYLRRVYPVQDEPGFLTLLFRQIVDQRTQMMMHREQVPELKRRCQEILDQLAGDAKFHRMARLYSEDDTSRTTGGLTGQYRRTMRRYPLEKTVFELETKAVAGPFFTRYGAELFKLESRDGERGSMSETLEVRIILLRYQTVERTPQETNALIRRYLQITSNKERFRQVLPPGLMKNPPRQFGPLDVAPLGDPTAPLTRCSDLADRYRKIHDKPSDG